MVGISALKVLHNRALLIDILPTFTYILTFLGHSAFSEEPWASVIRGLQKLHGAIGELRSSEWGLNTPVKPLTSPPPASYLVPYRYIIEL